MDDKSIEQNLKESADRIKTKDFSERWKDISGRIQTVSEVDKEVIKDAVLLEASGVNTSQSPVRKNFIISICALFLIFAVILAIVLPIVLNRNESPSYLNPDQLTYKKMSKDEFYTELKNSDIELVDISKFEINVYYLGYTDEMEIAGGIVEALDEADDIIAEIYFYKDIVVSTFDVGSESKEYVTNGIIVEYATVIDEEFYNSKAKATKNKIIYNISCLALEEDISSFFEKLFG